MRLDIHVHQGQDPQTAADLAVIRRGLIAILITQGAEVTALEDLQAADTALAGVVTDLVSGIDRLDTDFTALQGAIESGDDEAIAAEAAKVQEAVAALTAAKGRIDSTDPVPAPPADGTPADDSGL